MFGRTHKKRKPDAFTIITGIVLFGYIGYLFAGAWTNEHDALAFLSNLNAVFKKPFADYRNEYTVRGVLLFVAFFLVGYVLYTLNGRDYIPGEEMGSEHFMDPRELSRKLEDPNDDPDDPKNITFIINRTKSYSFWHLFIWPFVVFSIIFVMLTFITSLHNKQQTGMFLLYSLCWAFIISAIISYTLVFKRWYNTEFSGKSSSLIKALLFYCIILCIIYLLFNVSIGHTINIIRVIVLFLLLLIGSIIISVILSILRKRA